MKIKKLMVSLFAISLVFVLSSNITIITYAGSIGKGEAPSDKIEVDDDHNKPGRPDVDENPDGGKFDNPGVDSGKDDSAKPDKDGDKHDPDKDNDKDDRDSDKDNEKPPGGDSSGGGSGGGSSGNTGSADPGQSGDKTSGNDAIAGTNALVRGFGMKTYVCDVNEIVNSAGSATIELKEPQASSSMGFGCNPHYYIATGGGSPKFWTGGSYTSVSYDNSFVEGIPFIPSTIVPIASNGGMHGAKFDGGAASASYDAAYEDKYTVEKFKPIADYFGYKGNLENAVIVFEPFVIIQSEYRNGLFAYTYQSARCGMAAHNYTNSARGAADNVFWILSPQKGGVGLSAFDSGLWNKGGNGICTSTGSLGSICSTGVGGRVTNGRCFDTNSGYYAYGPGLANPEIEEPPEEVAEADADLLLYDWELNHIFPSMFAEKEGLYKGYLKVNSDQHTIDTSKTEERGTCAKETSYSQNGVANPDDYEVTYYEVESSGRIISADDSLELAKLFLALPSPAIPTRETMKEGYTYDTSSLTGNEFIDYGVNLVRWLFKDDGRVYSSLILPEIPEDYLTEVLGLTKDDVTTYDDITLVSHKRNSMCLIDDKLVDNFHWMGKYKITDSTVGYKTVADTVGCAGGHGDTDGDGDDDSCDVSHTYYKKESLGSIKPFNAGGSAYTNNYDFELTAQAYKYRTDTILTGRPDKKEDRLAYQPTSTSSNIQSSIGTRFKMTLMQTTGVVLKYFPEVPMLGSVVTGTDYTEPEYKKVVTIGEVQRSSTAGMMLVYKIVGDGASGNSYSDTSVGGSAQLGIDTTGFTAGGDFTVKANTDFAIKLSGYALDITESGDASFQERTLGNNVKSDWGCAGKEQLLNIYTNWAYQFLNPNNYQADFHMEVGGNKKYNNFSATVGGFSAKASQSTETGSYALTFKHGQLVEDAGFNAFIAALASDYEVDEGTAKGIWEASTIKKAVLNAIESDTSSVNQSVPQNAARGGGGLLGNSSHWYDEEVRQIVIRRYETPEAKIVDVIAQDKLDLGNASESLSGLGGRFGLTIYFSNSNITGFNGVGDIFPVYRPSANGGNISDSNSKGGVICHNLYVKNADFTVTTSTTATGKRD